MRVKIHHTHALIYTKYLPLNDPPYNQQSLKFYNLHIQNYSWWNGYRYLGHPRHAVFVAAVASQVHKQLTHITISIYICITYILHFFIPCQFCVVYMHINDEALLSILCSRQSLQEVERLPLSSQQLATIIGLLIPLPSRFRLPPLDVQPMPCSPVHKTTCTIAT